MNCSYCCEIAKAETEASRTGGYLIVTRRRHIHRRPSKKERLEDEPKSLHRPTWGVRLLYVARFERKDVRTSQDPRAIVKALLERHGQSIGNSFIHSEEAIAAP